MHVAVGARISMDKALVKRYLSHVGLMCKGDVLVGSKDEFSCTLRERLGHVRTLLVFVRKDPIIRFESSLGKDVCAIFIVPDMSTVTASLKHSSETFLSLMHRDTLLVHEEGILCNMMHEDMCSYASVPMSGEEDVDRLSVIEACMLGALIPVGTEASMPIYHHSSSELLSVLGVEYPLCIYRPLITEHIDPLSTIYIAASSRVVNTLKIRRDGDVEDIDRVRS